jgi:hypothetical protein
MAKWSVVWKPIFSAADVQHSGVDYIEADSEGEAAEKFAEEYDNMMSCSSYQIRKELGYTLTVEPYEEPVAQEVSQ